MKKKDELPWNWLRLLVVSTLVLGTFLRFINLDHKMYWYDEAYTSLRISGYTEAEYIQQAFNGRTVSVSDLRKYQDVNPEKGWFDTVKGLALEEPQHPPLYFVLVRLWVQGFGNSVTVIRSLSAVISLLIFPCTYWLCLELFQSPAIGWIAMALMAASPFHVLYAQEAREYSLWTVTTLVASAAFLRALRLKTGLGWGAYAAASVLNLYTFLFSMLVTIGHGVYVAVLEGFRPGKRATAYLLATAASLGLFVPWLLTVALNVSQVENRTGWVTQPLPLWSGEDTLMRRWFFNLSLVFTNQDVFNFGPDHPLTFPAQVMLAVSITALTGYSIYFLCRTTPPQIWGFVLSLIGATALALTLPDLISGGQRSTIPRYLIPSYLGIQLAVAYAVTTQLTHSRQRIWRVILVVLTSSGLLCCAISSYTQIGWHNAFGAENPKAARVVNRAERPLVITDSSDQNPGHMLSLTHLLDARVQLQLVREPNLPQIPDGFSEVFVFSPSDSLKAGLTQALDYQLQPVAETNTLWRLETVRR